MRWLRSASWLLLWGGLIVAVILHQDMLQGPDGATVTMFTGAVIVIAIGLCGLYITRRPGDGGFGF